MMSKGYFPLFVDLTEKKVLVIGAGRIATRRITTLLEFVQDRNLKVIAPAVSKEVIAFAQNGQVILEQRGFTEADVLDMDIVIAATDDDKLNTRIGTLCKEQKIIVNIASNKEQCDFYFPGIIKKDGIVVGVTASGEDHKKAKAYREYIEESISLLE